MDLLLYGLLPLLLYVLVDYFVHNLRTAIFAAIFFALIELVYMYSRLGAVDPASASACLLLIACGVYSVKRNSPLLFKIQPALVALIMAGFIAYLQYFSQPLLERYKPFIEQATPEALRSIISSAEFTHRVNGMMNLLPLILLLHGIWIFYTARYCKQSTWLAVNAFGFFVLLTPATFIYALFF